MSFWLKQNILFLEQKLNSVANILKVSHPDTLTERFAILRDQKELFYSSLQHNSSCMCTGGEETFTVLRHDSGQEILCLNPVIALIQGSDEIQDWIGPRIKKEIFRAFNFKRQRKITNYFGRRDETFEEQDFQQKISYPECNLDCILNELGIPEGKCFVQFVRKFKISLRIHKSDYLGCRSILVCDEIDSPTIHLYYNTGYSLVLPPDTASPHMETINHNMNSPSPIRRGWGSFSSPFRETDGRCLEPPTAAAAAAADFFTQQSLNLPSPGSSPYLASPGSIASLLCPLNDDENVLRDYHCIRGSDNEEEEDDNDDNENYYDIECKDLE